jgi:hypothetical protein
MEPYLRESTDVATQQCLECILLPALPESIYLVARCFLALAEHVMAPVSPLASPACSAASTELLKCHIQHQTQVLVSLLVVSKNNLGIVVDHGGQANVQGG